MFRLPLPLIAALAVAALPAAAQEHDAPLSSEQFRGQIEATANKAGKARLPVACGGLFRALRQIADAGSKPHERFSRLESDMAFFATVMRREETGEEMEAALEFVAPHMSNVSALYITRMARNRKSAGTLLDDRIRGDYGTCEGFNDRMNAALQK